MSQNPFRLTRGEFAVMFEPVHGWRDDADLTKTYLGFLRAVDRFTKEEILERIMKAPSSPGTLPDGSGQECGAEERRGDVAQDRG